MPSAPRSRWPAATTSRSTCATAIPRLNRPVPWPSSRMRMRARPPWKSAGRSFSPRCSTPIRPSSGCSTSRCSKARAKRRLPPARTSSSRSRSPARSSGRSTRWVRRSAWTTTSASTSSAASCATSSARRFPQPTSSCGPSASPRTMRPTTNACPTAAPALPFCSNARVPNCRPKFPTCSPSSRRFIGRIRGMSSSRCGLSRFENSTSSRSITPTNWLTAAAHSFIYCWAWGLWCSSSP